uniref:Reverse transcriptase Ty1/copia-type domain-containing protein n=1 Tax=Lactuca sativa TaxID=4236 RepID=A0A9R1VMX2_LACSA|nr:hypothetical protein LSAT_V11C400204180 [Lactuca sativa]
MDGEKTRGGNNVFNNNGVMRHCVHHSSPQSTTDHVSSTRCKKAMQKEVTALEQNNTWELTLLPPGKKVMERKPSTPKWVYKMKYKSNGEVERYKGRLVDKGYTQMEGMDFHDTFASVAKPATVRVLLTIAILSDSEDKLGQAIVSCSG